LGIIYKEKFKEFQYAVKRFEKLLVDNPEERLVLPSMYNLFKLYEILDKEKAEAIKNSIISQYPDSRYAQILLNPSSEVEESSDSPNSVYQKLYQQNKDGEFKTALAGTENAINRFTGDEIVPKLELLKAQITGKLNGLNEYKSALNFVSLNYPNSEEGKKAEMLITVDLPKLEALQLSKAPSKNWKVLYATKDFENTATKKLRDKIKKFITDRNLTKLSVSLDIYTMTDNFVVIHGMTSEDLANGVATVLKEFKEYKVQESPIIISTENYTIVQVKKNISEYLAGNLPDTAPQPNWDGTIEKAPVAQQALPTVNDSQQTKQPQNELNSQDKQPEGGEFGPPPSPGMPNTGKKG
jgi:hypothetical protein